MTRARVVAVCLSLLAASVVTSAADAAGIRCGGRTATIVGTQGADQLEGTPKRDVIAARGGADLVFGLSGGDLVCGGDGDDQIQGGGGPDRILGGRGSDVLFGESGADRLKSGGGDVDQVTGGAGDDELSGGNGAFDIASFVGGAQVEVNMATGSAQGQGTDTLRGFETVYGSKFADSITGDGNYNVLIGANGNDTLIGGGGGTEARPDFYWGGRGDDNIFGGFGSYDFATYEKAFAAVTVNLATGSATGGAGNDTLTSVDGALGSNFGDTLIGNAQDNLFSPGGGNDDVDGAAGDDAVDLSSSNSPVTVNLTTGTASGQGSDELAGIEDAFGSRFGDQLTGDNTGNSLLAGAGNDALFGLDGADYLDGGSGTDTADGGGAEADTCVNVESSTNCDDEPTDVPPIDPPLPRLP